MVSLLDQLLLFGVFQLLIVSYLLDIIIGVLEVHHVLVQIFVVGDITLFD